MKLSLRDYVFFGACWLAAIMPLSAWAGDSLPTGSVSLYNAKECPAGWSPLIPANGFFFVPLMSTATNTSTSGTALTPGNDVTHTHSVDSGIRLDGTSFIAIGGCCNKSLADDGQKNFSGTSDKSSSDLPYVALLACQKKDAPDTSPPAPEHTLMFFSTPSCPSGWSQNLFTQGRFVIGLPSNGTPGLAFGGAPLAPLERRKHAHSFSGDVATESRDVAVGSGCCAGSYGKKKTYGYSSTSGASDSDLPYMQILQCEKM